MVIAEQQTQSQVKAYCNVLALQKGLDPAGNAGDFDDAVVIETPLPWKKDLYQTAGALPQEMINLLALWLEQYKAGLGYRHRPLLIAPDAEYSRAGFRRVMFYTRQPGMFAHYDKTEFLVPEQELGALVWALYEAREDLPRFAQYRVPDAEATRDLLVCTHGTVDAACAKFGYPLYNDLRKHHASDSLRVWRVSHFGGHVFAPTMMDMPTGHYWAYVEETQAAQIVTYSSHPAALRGHYRGWAGLERGFMQAAEREMWQCEGWAWFTYHKSGEVLAQDPDEENPQWAEVRVQFASPDGKTSGVYEARIEVDQRIEAISTTGNTATHAFPQYVVTRLDKSVSPRQAESALTDAADREISSAVRV